MLKIAAQPRRDSTSPIFRQRGAHTNDTDYLFKSYGFIPSRDSYGNTIYTTKLTPLQLDKKVYGDGLGGVRDKAVQQNYRQTQMARAALAGQKYNPNAYYRIAYNNLYNKNYRQNQPYSALDVNMLSRPVYTIGPRGSQSFAPGYKAAYKAPYKYGSIADKDPVDTFIHQFAHQLTRSYQAPPYKGKDRKVFQSAPSLMQGKDHSRRFMWWLLNRRSPRNIGQRYLSKRFKPQGNYFNDTYEAAGSAHQLKGLAAAHGKVPRDWDWMRNWLLQQGMVKQKDNGQLQLTRVPKPIKPSDDSTGISYWLSLQNKARALQRSNKADKQKIQSKRLRDFMNNVFRVADNSTVSVHSMT